MASFSLAIRPTESKLDILPASGPEQHVASFNAKNGAGTALGVSITRASDAPISTLLTRAGAEPVEVTSYLCWLTVLPDGLLPPTPAVSPITQPPVNVPIELNLTVNMPNDAKTVRIKKQPDGSLTGTVAPAGAEE
jgi:hypothetical protein